MSLRRLLLLIAIIVGLGGAYYFFAGGASEVCTICQSFQSRTRCVTASAGTSDAAAERARRTACNELAPDESGRAKCFQSPPTSVQCRSR